MPPFYAELADRYTQSRKDFIKDGVLNQQLFQGFIDEIKSIRDDLKKYIETFVKENPHPYDALVAHWKLLLDEIMTELEADFDPLTNTSYGTIKNK